MAGKFGNAHQRPEDDRVRFFADYELVIGSEHSDHHSAPIDKMGVLFGRAGNDRLSGSPMGDELAGGKGNDHLTGGTGEDHLIGAAGNDRLAGGDDADTLMGGDGNDHLDEGGGHGDLEGGPGNDVLVGGLGADAFTISPESDHDIIKDFRAGPGMFDHLAVMDIKPEQLRFQDTAAGVIVSWETDKGDGSVLLEGVFKHDLAQDDFMFTDDRHLLNPDQTGADQVTAQHFDKEGASDNPPPSSGETTPQFEKTFSQNHIKFGTDDQNDTFQATANDDAYFGLGGDDHLDGGPGNDHLAGDAGNDVLDGADGQDDLRGGSGDDQLFGGAMADNLMGEDGDDYLSGGAGHDMLDGGAGADTYDGGDGADAFIVAHGSGDDIVVGGFDAGPGAFDHIAFTDVLPDEVSLADAVSPHADGHIGVRVSWSDGSIFLEGITKSEMAQDDFMFNAVEGGAFVPDPEVSSEGSKPLFTGGDPYWLV